MLFVNVSASDLGALAEFKTIAIGICGTAIVIAIFIVWSQLRVHNPLDRGVVIQGAFRSNMGIIGLAYCANAYGEDGITYASIFLGTLTIFYNLLCVIILNVYANNKIDIKRIVLGIISNPIILGIVAGLAVSFFRVPVPQMLSTSLGYFAQLTLPLALLCTGASLRFTSLGKEWKLVVLACFGKCIVYPVVLVGLALWFDVRGVSLGVIFLMSVSPSATAGYIMVRKIGGNHGLAAQIIACSTIVSLPLTIIAYYLMVSFTEIA